MTLQKSAQVGSFGMFAIFQSFQMRKMTICCLLYAKDLVISLNFCKYKKYLSVLEDEQWSITGVSMNKVDWRAITVSVFNLKKSIPIFAEEQALNENKRWHVFEHIIYNFGFGKANVFRRSSKKVWEW